MDLQLLIAQWSGALPPGFVRPAFLETGLAECQHKRCRRKVSIKRDGTPAKACSRCLKRRAASCRRRRAFFVAQGGCRRCAYRKRAEGDFLCTRCRDDRDFEHEQSRRDALDAVIVDRFAAQPERVHHAGDLDCGVSPWNARPKPQPTAAYWSPLPDPEPREAQEWRWQYVGLSALAQVEIRLNEQDGNDPCWKEHPEHGRAVDVVAVDVEDTFSKDNHTFNAVNGGTRFDERFHGSVTDDVFVIGYPLGLSGSKSERGAMPIYKRGSIASEPMVDFDQRPCLLIDCRTFSGMSGSPVVVSHSGIWMPEGKMTDDAVIGTVENLLGVYSGRMTNPMYAASGGSSSDIGVVWKMRTVQQVVEDGVRGSTLTDVLGG